MKIAVLAGGVGAARFLAGLIQATPPEELTVIVNTGDDFRWLSLYICPDLDTIIYTLAGRENPVTGWGLRGDTFHCLARLQELGCSTWFQLGDRDLATHIFRTQLLQSGKSLTEVTRHICHKNGIAATILPMTDTHVPTQVHTDEGTLPFQDYFVRRKCEPAVTGFTFDGIDYAQPAPGVVEALFDVHATIVCPSNPYISIGPILAVPGIRQALRESSARTVAITPIISGQAIKGPAARMLSQMGEEVSAVSVARMYRDFLDMFVLDQKDAALAPSISSLGLQVKTAATLMDTPQSKIELARCVIEMIA